MLFVPDPAEQCLRYTYSHIHTALFPPDREVIMAGITLIACLLCYPDVKPGCQRIDFRYKAWRKEYIVKFIIRISSL